MTTKTKLWLMASLIWVFFSIMQGLQFNNIPASINAFGAAAMIWLLLVDIEK